MLLVDNEKGNQHAGNEDEYTVHAPDQSRRPWRSLLFSTACAIVIIGQIWRSPQFRWLCYNEQDLQNDKTWSPICPEQPPPLVPSISFTPAPSYREAAAERLSQAVRIPTVSYDDNGEIGEDVGHQGS